MHWLKFFSYTFIKRPSTSFVALHPITVGNNLCQWNSLEVSADYGLMGLRPLLCLSYIDSYQ